MDKSTRKEKDQPRPVENHDTAAWANVESRHEVSKVNTPNDFQVNNAKEYVDSNEK